VPFEKQYNETEIVERAMRAFWAHGYEGTSIGDLVTATGINRGSLYSAYDGKRSLFIAALRHYDHIHRARFLENTTARFAPKEAIIAVFEAAAACVANNEQPGGCLQVNTALELSPHDPEIASLVQAGFNEVEAFFVSMIEDAQRNKTMRNSIEPKTTAKALLGLFLGLRVLARSNADKTTRDAVTSQVRMMLE